ncbi:MAG: hypothetical protein LUH51_07320, partial [Firmicutes bacterium]|nr:hypothetical protein [Bacillota bacterium]
VESNPRNDETKKYTFLSGCGRKNPGRARCPDFLYKILSLKGAGAACRAAGGNGYGFCITAAGHKTFRLVKFVEFARKPDFGKLRREKFLPKLWKKLWTM